MPTAGVMSARAIPARPENPGGLNCKFTQNSFSMLRPGCNAALTYHVDPLLMIFLTTDSTDDTDKINAWE